MALSEECTATVAYVKSDIDITAAACRQGSQSTIVGPIGEGFTVKPGDEVVTGKKSRIKISTSDGTTSIRLGSNQKLVLTPELLDCLPGSEKPLGIGTKIGSAISNMLGKVSLFVSTFFLLKVSFIENLVHLNSASIDYSH